MAVAAQCDISEYQKCTLHEHTEFIFRRGVEAVLPDKTISQYIHIKDGHLVTTGRQYKLSNNVYVVGFGKGVLGMAHQLDQIIGRHIQCGVISVPIEIKEDYIKNGKEDLLLCPGSRINMYEGAQNNLPDEPAYLSAMMIKKVVSCLTAADLLIVLISGGGSALLPAPEPPITVPDYRKISQLLAEHGATIQELNIIRKNIDELKGGGIARLAYPAKVLSLILSDIVDDPLDLIAGAPTVPDTTTVQECLDYFKTFELEIEIPRSVLEFLQNKRNEEQTKKVEIPTYNFDHVENLLVGSNSIALEASAKAATELGYVVHILSRRLVGEARLVAKMWAKLAIFIGILHGRKEHCEQNSPTLVAAEMDLIKNGISKTNVDRMITVVNKASNVGQDICVIGGGETTVTIKGTGKGGRNQELCLAFAIELDKMIDPEIRSLCEIEFLAAGTDGQDGPTDATGAFSSLETITRAEAAGLIAEEYLQNNDSYTFFHLLGESDHLKTGLTGTNVMDVSILLVRVR